MENLKLNFDTEIMGERRSLIVEVPYREGLVATSEFCPTELLEGSVELMAAVRGEPLESFMERCRMQLTAMSRITEATTDLDRHIGALMAVVMERLSRDGNIAFGELLLLVDCFALLLKADGTDPADIHRIYPRVLRTIVDLYPSHITSAFA